LGSLRVFEAVAAHLSFSEAADALNVTPAAVSQQIKTLESYIQVPLFRRSGRRVEITDEGLELLPAVREGRRIAALDAQRLIGWRTLQVVVGAPFLPRLEDLRVLFPDLRVTSGRIAVPLGLGSAEEALALCAAERLPVLASWIDYRG